MPVTLNASTSSGLIATSDTSGTIALQSNGSTKATISSSGFSYPGAVLQVVQGTISTQTTTTSVLPTYVDTGLTASITPTSSSSKILVIAQIASPSKSAVITSVALRLVRNSTEILVVGQGWIANNGTSVDNGTAGCPLNFLDSPATTSSTTYKVQFCTETSGTVRVHGSNTTSTIILMEIAA